MATSTKGRSLSVEVLAALKTVFADVANGRWRQAVMDAFGQDPEHPDGIDEDLRETVQGLRKEPDAYALDAGARWLHFFEIEVYNPMSQDKLTDYALFSRAMDFYGIEFAVIVVNKYGHMNVVDLMPHYIDWLNANAPD